jgi:anti-anti-sigma factor
MTFTTLVDSTRRPPGLVVSMSAEGTATVVELRGEADLATLPVVMEMLDRVISDHEGAVVIDLGGTRFIDTATVRALGQASETLRQQGRPLTIREPSALAARVLELLGLSQLILAGGGDDE